MPDDLTDSEIDALMHPVHEGLTEVQTRAKAAETLGADVVAGMTISEIIETLNNDE